MIDSMFFKDFPNWNKIFAYGDAKQRAFVTQVALRDVPIPLEESYHPRIMELFSVFASDVDSLRKGKIYIHRHYCPN